MKQFNMLKVGALALGGLLYSLSADAQITYPYVGDFEVANTNPASKSYASTDDIVMNGMTWKMPGVFLGTMTASDRKNDEKSARMRLTENTSGDAGSIYTVEDFSAGVATFSFKAAQYGSETGDSIAAYYSTNGGVDWILIANEPVEDTLFETFTYTLNQSGNVRLKIQKGTTKNLRINIDDIMVTPYCLPTAICLTSKTPMGADIAPSTNTISLAFTQDIAVGTGDIVIHKADGTVAQTIDIATASTTIDGNTITIAGINLENATAYYVLMEEGVITKDGDATVVNEAITSVTDWTFSTADTTPVTSFIEDFTTCTGSTIGNFTGISVTGTDVWHCHNGGYGDAPFAARINGGFAAGESRENEDYLIYNKKVATTGFATATLKFQNKIQFSGDATLSVKISRDYDGVDPTAATWETVASFNESDLGTDWNLKTVSLPISAESYNIAFVYECGTTGAYAFSLDNVEFSTATSITTPTQYNMNVAVLGLPTNNEIKLQVEAPKAEIYTAEIIDINGKIIHTTTFNTAAGMNYINLSNVNLAAGMHAVRIYNKDYSNRGSVKAIVR